MASSPKTPTKVASPNATSPSSPTKPGAQMPANWLVKHDLFVRDHARNGEDAESIRILFEVEYPGVKVTKAWITERMVAKAK